MAKTIFALLFSLFTVAVLPATAQKSNMFMGGNLIYGFPSSALKTGYKNATGIDASLGFGTSKVYFIGTLGYVSYKEVSGNPYGKITVIPVKGGIRFYPAKYIFLTGNAGVGFLKDQVMSGRESRFMYDAGIGFHLTLAQISVHYDAWKKKNTDGYSAAVMLKLGIAIK